jgi:hypothetical protein
MLKDPRDKRKDKDEKLKRSRPPKRERQNRVSINKSKGFTPLGKQPDEHVKTKPRDVPPAATGAEKSPGFEAERDEVEKASRGRPPPPPIPEYNPTGYPSVNPFPSQSGKYILLVTAVLSWYLRLPLIVPVIFLVLKTRADDRQVVQSEHQELVDWYKQEQALPSRVRELKYTSIFVGQHPLCYLAKKSLLRPVNWNQGRSALRLTLGRAIEKEMDLYAAAGHEERPSTLMASWVNLTDSYFWNIPDLNGNEEHTSNRLCVLTTGLRRNLGFSTSMATTITTYRYVIGVALVGKDISRLMELLLIELLKFWGSNTTSYCLTQPVLVVLGSRTQCYPDSVSWILRLLLHMVEMVTETLYRTSIPCFLQTVGNLWT